MKNFFSLSALLIASLAFTLTSPVQAQGLDINGGYENGIFSGSLSFAGGLAQDLNAGHESVSPTFHSLPFSPWLAGWYQTDLNAAYWVESSAAYDGNHYLYLSGKDVCFNLVYGDSWGTTAHLNGLVVGQTYQMCVWAAAADSTDQTLRFEWTPNGGSTDLISYTLAGNSAWSDTTLSAIPWQQYCYTFTPTTTDGVLTMSTNATTSTSIVLDGASLVALPEPGSALLITVACMIQLRRRRR